MSHCCMICGQYCCCDMEDHDQPQPDDCTHRCSEDDFDDDDELYAPDAPMVALMPAALEEG